MKRILAAILAILMLSACALAEADTSVEYIEEKGTFVLGLDDSFPPMGFRDENNEIVGFDIDVAQAMCDKLGWELVVQPIDWSAKEMELANKEIDCIWNGMSITPAREEAMSMTGAYLNNKIVLVALKDKGYASLDDVKGMTVGTQNGSFAEEVVTQYEDYADFYAETEVLGYDDYLTALMDLQNGGLDGVLIDLVVAEYTLTSMGDETIVVVDELEDDLYGIGFRKEDVALRDLAVATLKDLDADGTLADISEKWFGADITVVKDWA